jgi:transposase
MDYFIGVDVSKRSLDLAVVRDGLVVQQDKIENGSKAMRSFLSGLTKGLGISFDQVIVCLEHTGIYNAHVLEVCWNQGIRICLEPAAKIKGSLGGIVRGKSDKIDAQRIASYAFKNARELVFWQPERLIIQKLKALLSLRNRLMCARNQLRVPLNESAGFLDKSIVKEMATASRRAIESIKKEINQVDKQIKSLIQQDSSVDSQVEQITSVPGIGQITALNMIITTGEFTRINEPKKFACYAGVAPFEHSSGSSVRGKTKVSKKANMAMKTLLHMAAMAAITCNSELKAFYTRKVAQGKNKMSVINAVRNKLISRAFACVKAKRKYQNNYQLALA